MLVAGIYIKHSILTFAAGEINTLQGNLNWVASREHSLSNPVWEGREHEFLPLCNAAESDSANLDHVAELLVCYSYDFKHHTKKGL